jgi:hypothetical protein
MMGAAASDPSSVPAIVLLVEDDRDISDLFSAHFQAGGLWMATAATSCAS